MKRETNVPKIVNDKVICEICGKGFDDLAMHVRLHGLKTYEYKIQFGYASGQSLATKKSALKRVKSGQSNSRAKFVYSSKAREKKPREPRLDIVGDDIEDIIDL